MTLHMVFTKNLGRWKIVIYAFFLPLLGVISFTHIDSTLLNRWAVLQRVILCISHTLKFPNIFVLCLSLNFMILHRASPISGSVVLLRHNIIIIIIIIYSLEFFTLVLADGLLLEFEWQQISSNIHDSPQYSGRSQWYSCFDGLHSSSNFQVLQSL